MASNNKPMKADIQFNTNVQGNTDEKLRKDIMIKVHDYLQDQLPNIPKNVQIMKDDEDGYLYRFDGFVQWNESKGDFFISDETATAEQAVATVTLKLASNHPLAYIHYSGNYHKRRNNN